MALSFLLGCLVMSIVCKGGGGWAVAGTLSRQTTYVCRAVGPLNSRTATKVALGWVVCSGWGFNSGIKNLVPASKG